MNQIVNQVKNKHLKIIGIKITQSFLHHGVFSFVFVPTLMKYMLVSQLTKTTE